METDDVNAAFSIAFKTIPEDSTGVFHILEHSVLCGSEKYPVKEPFVELLKSSVQTFLNAMTFADKTVYPVSSRNEKDLLNLMDVYLDAVFHPAIYGRPEIFRQEGWRYEDDELSGVVLNEMRGNFASPGAVLSREMNKLLFPNSCYRFVSGGDPDEIPNLTYDSFIEAHRRFYHPSNAYITLVGRIDADAALEKLDGYLSAFERREMDLNIPIQGPTKPRAVTACYEAGSEDDGALVSFASLLSSYNDRQKNYAVSMLADYLTGDDDAPLKRAVLEKELAQDLSVSVHDGIKQTWVSVDAMNADADRLEELRMTVRDTLENIVKNGLDRERLHACFNRYSFAMRDYEGGGMPQSVTFALDMLDSWIYGGDPADGICVDRVLNELAEKLDTDFFAGLIRDVFLDNDRFQTVVLLPSSETVKKEFAFSDDIIKELSVETERMYAWQETPDTEEAIATIPKLSLSDLAEKPEPLEYSVKGVSGANVLFHVAGSKNALVHAHFNAADTESRDLFKLSLIARMLGNMGTKAHTRDKLPLAVKNTFGRIEFYPTALPGKNAEGCKLMLTASFACLPENTDNAFVLLREILLSTDWTDVSQLRDALMQMEFGARFAVPAEGNRYAMLRAGARVTSHTAANELMGGISFNEKVKKLVGLDDGALLALLGEMRALAEKLFTRNRLTLSVSETVSGDIAHGFITSLPERKEALPEDGHYKFEAMRREDIPITSDVGFAGIAGSLESLGVKYSGSMEVLAGILNYTHLWSEIRLAGGAYGCGFYAGQNGDLFFHTFRDPDPENSLEVFKRSGDFIRDYMANDPDLTGYILSSVSALDPLRAPEGKLSSAEARFFTGKTNADAERNYCDLIHTTSDDVLACAQMLDGFAEKGAAVILNRGAARENS
ncbi:MAG: insulinase family protein [Clostridia bacterium]|nr:insulinase family protein [Clostridia bacterium]